MPFRLLLLFPLVACGGGGGGSNVGVGERYDVESFAYHDPYPADFQPLGSTAFRVARREEIAVLSATGSGTGHAVAHDDAGQQFRQLSLFGPSLFGAGFVAAASAAGNLDATPGDELAVIGHRGNNLEIAVLSADSGGQWTTLFTFTAANAVPALAHLTIEVVDLDGDEPEEILVAATYTGGAGGWVRVFDDAPAGFALRYNLDVGGCNLLQALPCDFDGDGAQEILVFSREAQRAVVRFVEGGRKRFAFRGEWAEIDPTTRRIVVGNFDHNTPAPELAALLIEEIPGNGLRFYCRCYELDAGAWHWFSHSPLMWDAYPPTEIMDAVACDPDGDHVDEIVSVLQYGSPSRALVYLWTSPIRPSHFDTRQILTISDPHQVSLTALDADADGCEEVAIAHGPPNQNLSTKVFGYPKRPSGNNELTWLCQTTAPCAAGTVSTMVAAGDFDRENVVLRSTGRKWLDLAEPMPIALLAAPPTRSGIGQNRDASATAYGTQQSIEYTHGVTTGLTASFSVGMEVSGVFDLFSASVKQTLSVQMEKTLSTSKKVTWTKTYTGSHDQDAVVFQGTLYQVYEYEIVSAVNPALVGGKVTLNDPVATRTYKWTLDFYNQTVPAKARIGTDVVTHTIGDPASYRRKSAAASLLHTRYGWIDDVGLEVGQGAGSNATSVTITTANSTEETRRFGIDWEAEIKVGGPTIGGSFGLNTAEIYGVTVEAGTSYQGQVGDILDTGAWSEWRYRFGLLVYRHGADPNGTPERGARPFHVVTYWVDQLGPGYPRP